MLQRIKQFILQHNMVEAGDHLILGVSGGADSVCLLKVIAELKSKKLLPGEWDYEILHVEHGIRGEESLADARFVEKIAGCMQVPVKVVSVDVPEFARENKLGDEEAARILRYQAFSDRAKSTRGKIVLAHHMEDNAETVLFQMLRGSGLKGLCGMMPVRCDAGVDYIRPLLCVSRQEIEEYLSENGTDYCTDSTNKELVYSRNRLRNVIFPELKEINNQAVLHINQSAQKLNQVWDFLYDEVKKQYDRCVIKEPLGLSIKTGDLSDMHEAVKSELILMIVSKVAGKKKDIGQLHIDAVLSLMGLQSGREVSLPYNVVARKEFDRISFSVQVEAIQQGSLEKELKTVRISDLKASDKVSELLLEENKVLSLKCFEFDGNMEKIPKKAYTKWFDYDKIKSDVQVRKRASGDYFINDISGHRKKLKQYFTDEKIPVSERTNMWLMAEGSHVIWIIGGRISEHYKVSSDTQTILEVEYTRGK